MWWIREQRQADIKSWPLYFLCCSSIYDWFVGWLFVAHHRTSSTKVGTMSDQEESSSLSNLFSPSFGSIIMDKKEAFDYYKRSGYPKPLAYRWNCWNCLARRPTGNLYCCQLVIAWWFGGTNSPLLLFQLDKSRSSGINATLISSFLQNHKRLARRIVAGLIKPAAMCLCIGHDPYANTFRIDDDTYIFSPQQKPIGRHHLTWKYTWDWIRRHVICAYCLPTVFLLPSYHYHQDHRRHFDESPSSSCLFQCF
jgi:hypothetical protein